MGITQSAPSAAGHNQFRPRIQQFADQALGFIVPGFGSDGDRNDQVVPILAVLVIAAARAPGFRALAGRKIQVLQGIDIG